MKCIFGLLVMTFFSSSILLAQQSIPIDKSPLDVSYYPNNYPMLKLQEKVVESPSARIVYSRPAKAGRIVFGELVPFGQIWRLGANEATEIEFFKNVKIGGKAVPKGRYTIYVLPTEKNWTFIINKDTDCWGAFKYDSKKDVARVDVPVEKTQSPLELLTLSFEKTSNGCGLSVAWDSTKALLPIQF